MRMKVFTGTYFKIEEDLNNFFSSVTRGRCTDKEWKDDIDVDNHVLVVFYTIH